MAFPTNPSPGDSYTDTYGTVWVYAGAVNGWYRQEVSTPNDTSYTAAISGPAGSNTQVQFNDNGELAGDSGLTYNKTTDALSGGAFIPTGSTVPTNGVYLPSANNVALSTNGTGRLFVDSSGNVGVGAAASTWNLGRTVEVSGTKSVSLWNPGDGFNALSNAYYNSGYKFATTGGYGLYYQQNTGSGAHIFASSTTTGTANGAATFSELARITADGKLGLGTSSPADTLDVRAATATGRFEATGGSTPAYQQYKNSGGSFFVGVDNSSGSNFASLAYSAVLWQTGARAIAFGTNNLTRAVIDSSGRLGVGTTSPTSLLFIRGAAATATISSNTNTANLDIINSTQTTRLGAANNDFAITHNGSERARIDSSGRLLVGTSSATGLGAAKTVIAETSATAAQRIVGNGNSQGDAQKITVVRHYPVVSLGTKLIIPFVSQGNLSSTTICKVWGHGARFNNRNGLAFEVTFAVGSLTLLSDLSSWGGGGNYASIAINGMNIEITFTTPYTWTTADGVFVCLEYMTSRPGNTIDVPNIAMN